MKEILKEHGLTLPEGFCVGFAGEVANPPAGVSLGGHGVANAKERLSTENWDELKVLCTAFSDGENLVLAYTFDSCHIAEVIANPLFALLKENYGIPEENVFFNATHTHAAPVMYSAHSSFPGVRNFLDTVFYPAFLKATEDAVSDLSPATVSCGRGKTEGLSYVRRYLSKEDGSFLGNWPEKDLDPALVCHESHPDEEMQILRFAREGKQDVVMINWQCHPTSAGGSNRTNTSADWVGILRNIVEEKAGVRCVFHQGAAGNVIASGMLRGENRFGWGFYKDHGEKIAEVALGILNAPMKPVKSGKVLIEKKFLTLKRKDGDEDTIFPLTAFSFGEVAFATVPYEMFSENGKQLKEASPFEMTFVCENTDGDHNYVPSKEAFQNGGYEVRICPVGEGSGELVVENLLSMLKKQHQAQ